MQRLQRLHVRVPGSTSNLGPGFDCLGLALGLFLDASGETHGDAHRVTYEARSVRGSSPQDGTSQPGWTPQPDWAPEDDLVMRAVRAYERRVNRTLAPLHIRIDSEIPVGRGFGSSGAAVAATLLLAATADGAGGSRPLGRRELVSLALQLEGHPDNAAASLLGGCTVAVPTPDDPDGNMAIVQPPVHASLGLAVAWPETPLFTQEARAALPLDVPLKDAIENPRRLALLLEGLRTGDARLLRLGVVDRIHERHRLALVPGAQRAIESAVEAGALCACLSGAGSGVVAIGPADAMGAAGQAMARHLTGGIGRAVEVVGTPPRVIPE